MNPGEIAALMAETFGEKVVESKLDVVSPWSQIDPTSVLEVCEFLKNDERLLMDHLELLGGVDYQEHMHVVYITYSMKHRHRFTLKCQLPRESATIQTVESVWRVANWHEREVYDMFGGLLRRALGSTPDSVPG